MCFGIVAAAAAPVLPSHQLRGKYSDKQLMAECNGKGTFFNTPDGGYGCAGKGGTVTCTSDKTCTGTCQACQQAAPSRPGGVRPANPVGDVRPPSVTPFGQGHPVIPGGRLPASSGGRLPPSGGMITAYVR